MRLKNRQKQPVFAVFLEKQPKQIKTAKTRETNTKSLFQRNILCNRTFASEHMATRTSATSGLFKAHIQAQCSAQCIAEAVRSHGSQYGWQRSRFRHTMTLLLLEKSFHAVASCRHGPLADSRPDRWERSNACPPRGTHRQQLVRSVASPLGLDSADAEFIFAENQYFARETGFRH